MLLKNIMGEKNCYQQNLLLCKRKMCVATGLIIDAFGELRDQQEQVKEDMEVRVQLNFACVKTSSNCKKGKYVT